MFASPIQLCIGLGRILPVVPHLVELAEYLLLSNLGASPFLPGALGLHVKFTPEEVCSLNADQALEILLSLHRLLSTKHETFLALLDSATLCHLRYHPHRAVRYMAVRLLCRCLKATESAREDMLQNYGVGKHSEKILGVWEGREVDYGFLT
jgi:midasin